MLDLQEKYNYAKKIIPGGTQLLSKRPERFLPSLWPTYYTKAKGCRIWDLNGKKYYDFASMGIGTCALGYADDDVNKAVRDAVNSGSMTTLNCYEEVKLAEKLLQLHPWGGMVRYARTGGEACSIAIRIARAVTGRSKILFCGYHGWHDWYIAANLESDSNLTDQLLPNILPKGVPVELAGTSIPFKYNDVKSLEDAFELYGDSIAAIIFEIQRGAEPEKAFLSTIARLAKQYKTLIICDEVTSGFRMNVGGIHMNLGFTPDIAVFGKTISNGYAMAAIIGKYEIMKNSVDSFISSAYWTEKIGPAAALATIEKMETLNIPQKLINYGKLIESSWIEAAKNNNLKIKITGIPPLLHLDFDYEFNNAMQTYFSQLMLEKGFLVGPLAYSTAAYNEKILRKYSQSVNEAFYEISVSLQRGNLFEKLKSEVRTDAFTRLVY